MAEKVAEWPKLYNCDGINLDLEDGAGNRFKFNKIFLQIIFGSLVSLKERLEKIDNPFNFGKIPMSFESGYWVEKSK